MSNSVKGKEVEVLPGTSIVYFTGGEDGKDYEIGNYCFWVAEGEDKYGPWSVIGRSLEQLSPTDRFERMDQERLMSPSGEDRAAYQMCWNRFDDIQHIRPACMREICRWFETHKDEGVFADAFATMNGVQQVIPRAMI